MDRPPPAPLTGQAEALLLPVLRLVDPSPDDLLHQILRVGAMDAVGVFHGPVSHVSRSCAGSSERNNPLCYDVFPGLQRLLPV